MYGLAYTGITFLPYLIGGATLVVVGTGSLIAARFRR